MSIKRLAASATLASAIIAVTIISASAIAAPAAHASSGPSFNDPQGLCGAIVYLPTPGWHHTDGLGWYCVSDLRQYGASGPGRGLTSTFQYSVSGDGYHSATQVQLFFTVNVPATRRSGLKQMREYAKTMSANTDFHLSSAMLRDIASGKGFSVNENTFKVSFKLHKMRKDQYVLQIDKLGE